MKPILTRLFAGLFLLLAAQAFGQTLTTSFVVTQPAGVPDYPIGTHIIIELRVNGFNNIESMQFPITYNKDAMKFDSISDPAFSNWNAGNFVSSPALGKIGISWDGYSGGASMPFTFPDGTAIFKLHFTAIGNGISTVNINPSANPPAVDVVGNGAPVTLNYQSGGTPPLILGTGNPPPPPLVGFKIVANTIYIPQGERGCMPVTVNDFDNIVSMQWAMHWDNTVLNYECTRAYNLDGWSNAAFNQPTGGTLLAGWDDASGTGKTRADGVRIVDVCFKAVGAPGATTNVTIDGLGFPAGNGGAEAFNTSSVDVWTTGGTNGASGVTAPINIIVVPNSSFDVTYTIDQIEVPQTTEGCVAVKVKNFTAVTRAEFAMTYNTADLTFKSTQTGANPLGILPAELTHVSNLSPGVGVVKFNWTNANGKTVANDGTIFSVCFDAIGPIGTTTNLTITSTPCPTITGIGTAKAGGGVSMAKNNGSIKIVANGPTLVPAHVNCFGGATGSIALTNPPSSTPMTYVWAGPGINGTNQGMEDPTGLIAGTYTVTVTYSGGTTGTKSVTVTQPAAAVTQTNSVNTVSCFGGSNGAINLTPAGGTAPYTFNWQHGSTTEDVNNLGVSIYTVTITDSKLCTATANITVTGFTEIKLGTPAQITDVSCNGLSNGAISLTAIGGAGNYTYLWSNGNTSNPLANMPKGTYSVIVTDGNGCSKTFSNLTINEPQLLAGSLVSKTDAICFNSPTGSANIDITGGTGGKTICWFMTPGPCLSQVEDPSNLMPGTYTTVITDQKGCTATITNTVIANPPSALSVDGTTIPSPCFDQGQGSINATATGGWGTPYGYSWTGPISPIAQIPNPNNLPGGTYTVTVTDSKQCTVTKSFVVGGSPAIVSSPTVQNVTCFDAADGSIDLNLTGGNPGYQVVWSNTTLLGESIGVLTPGSYQPTVTDAQGCTKVFPAVVVTGPDVLLVDTAITVANPNNGAIDLVIMSGGTPGFTYLWSNGATTQDIANLTVGVYTVTITDAKGCTNAFPFEVKSGNVLGGTTYTTKNSCSQSGCIILNFPATSAAQTPFTLNWGLGTDTTSALKDSICGLNAGAYNVTVTAQNGNTVVLSNIQIGQSDPASVNSNTSQPFSSLTKNGKITLTPAGVNCQLQYQWGPLPLNATTAEVSNLGQGTYFVTVTNPCSGCTSVHEFTLTYSPLACVSTNTDSPTCATTNDGLIDITVQGGFLPYNYDWTGPNGYTSTVEDINNLEPGVYTLVTTDQDGRSCSQAFTLDAQSTLNITNVNETSLQPSGHQVSSEDICNGAASVVFVPGIGTTNITWSNGVTTADNTTLCGGAYSVTVTDAAGCSSVWSDLLTAPPAITMTPDPIGVVCADDCNGSAKVLPAGGGAPYKVRWSTGQFDPLVQSGQFSQAVNLCGGDYSVTITDMNSVDKVFTVNVPQPPAIVASFAETTPRNFNACDGELLIDAAGAVAPITYVWSGSFGHTGTGERADNLCSGEFVEFYITDANGCTAYATDSVPYPEDGCFRVSPVLTPEQQDGKNDFVIITCIETSVDNTMEIYNRWGQLVFETEGYSNSDGDIEHNWNGLTSSGAVLAEGVYYYVLSFKYIDDQGIEREETRKGAINLLR